MFTKDESKELFTRVMDRMVEARWLKSYTFTDGKGYHLTWTEAGTERALSLKKIAESFRLIDDDRAALGFDVLAHGDSLLPFMRPYKLDESVAGFWRESIEQVGLHGDQDGLLALVHIIIGWTPGLDTPLKFGVAE